MCMARAASSTKLSARANRIERGQPLAAPFCVYRRLTPREAPDEEAARSPLPRRRQAK